MQMRPDFEEGVDVVVVGSGSRGCAAALAFHDHGFRTILLEKGAVAGGGTSYSSGGIWIPARPAARERDRPAFLVLCSVESTRRKATVSFEK